MTAPVGDQDEVFAFLARSETHGTDDPVERIDTHAASIFLAGDRAMKIKRAISLPYLDFTSPEKRREVLEAELALNLRTAPELYLEVRPVRRSRSGELGFDEGDPVDWVLVMRRFPADALLSQVAARGDLDQDLLQHLADAIAGFHDTAPAGSRQGGAERVRAVIEGNRESMARQREILEPASVDALYRHSMAWVDELASLLDARAEAGYVRRCHGDLHLANICLWDGQPLLFDCLEFDEDLAMIDVLYDLAFLLMDLWERGHRRAASLVFNRYCDMTGETGGVATLPLFLSMRAAIRAHVAASAASRENTASDATPKRAEADAYLNAAAHFLERGDPRLVAIGGRSGTGKSTLAGNVAHTIGRAPGARWLRSDVLRKRMAGMKPEESLPPAAYTDASSRMVYEKTLADAETVLATGQSVILDAAFLALEDREDVRKLALRAGSEFTGIWLHAPRELLCERVSARTGDASDADVSVVERQLERDVGGLEGWTRIDASGTADEVAESLAALELGTP